MSPIFGKFWCYFGKWNSLCKKYWCNILATFETIGILLVLSHWFVSEFETHHCLDNAEGASQQDDDADDVVDVDDVRARASCTAQNHILCCNAISHRRATAKIDLDLYSNQYKKVLSTHAQAVFRILEKLVKIDHLKICHFVIVEQCLKARMDHYYINRNIIKIDILNRQGKMGVCGQNLSSMITFASIGLSLHNAARIIMIIIIQATVKL